MNSHTSGSNNIMASKQPEQDKQTIAQIEDAIDVLGAIGTPIV